MQLKNQSCLKPLEADEAAWFGTRVQDCETKTFCDVID